MGIAAIKVPKALPFLPATASRLPAVLLLYLRPRALSAQPAGITATMLMMMKARTNVPPPYLAVSIGKRHMAPTPIDIPSVDRI